MITSPEFQQAIDAEYERLVEHLATLGAEVSRIEGRIEDLNRLREDQAPAEAPKTTQEAKPPAKPKPATKQAKAVKAPSKASGGTSGKTSAQDLILEALRDEGGPLSGTDLVRLLDSSASTVSNALKILAERGVVELAGTDGGRKLWHLKTRQVGGATPAAKPAKQLGVDFGSVQVAISRLDRAGDIKYEGDGWRAVL